MGVFFIHIYLKNLKHRCWKDYLCLEATNLSSIPSTSIRILFFIFVLITQLLFKELEEKLEDAIVPRSVVGIKRNQFSFDLDCWMRFYDMVCRLVDEINQFFGLTLLIDLTWIFSKSIATFCNIILSYGFLVTIALRYDLNRMYSDFNVLNFHYFLSSNSTTKNNNPVNSSITNYFMLLWKSYSINSPTAFAMALNIITLVLLWLRLMVILIPSNNMQNQVMKTLEDLSVVSFMG